MKIKSLKWPHSKKKRKKKKEKKRKKKNDIFFKKKLVRCVYAGFVAMITILDQPDDKTAENYTTHQIFVGFAQKYVMGLTPIVMPKN